MDGGGTITFEPSEIQTLIDLGLTPTQARIYLTLTRFGPLKTTSISKQSKIARPDVYRTLSRLQELSLVEQLVETPVRFRATPIDKGVETLLNKKTQQYQKTKQDSEALLATFNSKENPKELQSADSSFILVPKKETVIKRLIEAIQGSEKSIDAVLTWNRFYVGLDLFGQHIKEACDRKVKVRYVVQAPHDEKLKNDALRHETEYYKPRFIKEKPEAIFGIYDQKKVFVLVDPLIDTPGGSPSLWTNNPSLIYLIQMNFDNLWTKAKR